MSAAIAGAARTQSATPARSILFKVSPHQSCRFLLNRFIHHRTAQVCCKPVTNIDISTCSQSLGLLDVPQISALEDRIRCSEARNGHAVGPKGKPNLEIGR